MSQGRVLIVEDDPSIRQLVRTILEVGGYDVTEVGDGPAAYLTARELSPDVILLDVGLPGMDGFDVLTLLKRDPDLQHIPVMMVTGRTEPELAARALERGAHDYLRKPFDVGELGARVDAAARFKVEQDARHFAGLRVSSTADQHPLTL